MAARPVDPRVDIGHVHLKVADLDRALGFYRDVLGFELSSVRAAAAFLSAGGYHPPPHRPQHVGERGGSPPPPGTTGLYHVAILYPDARALADACARVLAAGIGSTAADHGVNEALYLRDPDGNGVELYRDRPREEWPPTTDDARDVRMTALDVQALAEAARSQHRRRPVSYTSGVAVDAMHVEQLPRWSISDDSLWDRKLTGDQLPGETRTREADGRPSLIMRGNDPLSPRLVRVRVILGKRDDRSSGVTKPALGPTTTRELAVTHEGFRAAEPGQQLSRTNQRRGVRPDEDELELRDDSLSPQVLDQAPDGRHAVTRDHDDAQSRISRHCDSIGSGQQIPSSRGRRGLSAVTET